MDIPVLIAAVILTLIAAAEVVCLLHCPKVSHAPLTVLIRSDTSDLEEKLRYAAYLLTSGDSPISRVIILERGEDYTAKALCARFCAQFPDCTAVINEKNENFLQKIIDFTSEI